MSDQKPNVFIASTKEGAKYVRSLANKLNHIAVCHMWDRGFFNVSEFTPETLTRKISNEDFVIIILTADDETESRGTSFLSPRDNLIFEAGIGFGSIGTSRTILVPEKNSSFKVPSDLNGFTMCQPFDSNSNPDYAMDQVSYQIEEKINSLGPVELKMKKVGKQELTDRAINLILSSSKNIMLFGRDLSWAETYSDALKKQIESGVKVEVFSEVPESKIAKNNFEILSDIGIKLYQFNYDIGVKFTMIDNDDSRLSRFMIAYKEKGKENIPNDFSYHCEFHNARSSRVMWLTLNRLYKMHKDSL